MSTLVRPNGRPSREADSIAETGAESVVARAGDFFIVPPHTIHREVTGNDVDLEAFIHPRVGGEPEHVNVEGPDSAGG